MTDEPVGWKVVGTQPPSEKLRGPHKLEVYEITFDTKEEADAYKRNKQAAGWVVSVVPIFLSPQRRGKERMKGQGRTAPKQFNREWKLYDQKGGGG